MSHERYRTNLDLPSKASVKVKNKPFLGRAPEKAAAPLAGSISDFLVKDPEPAAAAPQPKPVEKPKIPRPRPKRPKVEVEDLAGNVMGWR